jgi:hypothetical protein
VPDVGPLRPRRTLPDRRLPGKPGSRPIFFLRPPATGTITIGQALETDLGRPITASVVNAPDVRVVGKALELDIARQIVAIKGLAPPPPSTGVPQRVVLGRYTLEVAWASQAKGAFVIGTSTLGGTDTFGVSTFDVTFGGPYDDISTMFRGATVVRGRDDDRTFIMQGRAEFKVKDPTGMLNPENPTSPIADLLQGHYQHVRFRGFQPNGQMWPLYYGFLEKIEWAPRRRFPGSGVATLVCKDLLLWLSEARPIIAPPLPDTTGGAIGRILDSIGWVDPQARSLGVGDLVPSFSTDGSKSALDVIGELLQAERGTFFVDGAGRAVYQDRVARQVASPVATIGGDMHAAVPSVDHARLRNRVRVKRSQSQYVATAIDPTSKTQIGDRDLEDFETIFLMGDSQADALAAFILAQLSTPVAPMRDLKIDNRTDALLTQCLARELGDVVILAAPGAGIVNPQYLIDSLEHKIDPRRLSHETTWLLSKHSAVTPFRIGSSLLVASTSSPGDAFVY